MKWVIANCEEYNITTVCLSLEDNKNYDSEIGVYKDLKIRRKIQILSNKNVAVIIASGNGFFEHQSQQGMSYPAIIRECISVGAVYDSNKGSLNYSASSASAYSTGKDRITPFSQRLHTSKSETNATTIFAPGAPITSSGIKHDSTYSTQEGTSQAAPVVAGAVLLIQELYFRYFDEFPQIEEIKRYLQHGAVKINDGDNEDDNVVNTGLNYLRLDIFNSLNIIEEEMKNKKST